MKKALDPQDRTVKSSSSSQSDTKKWYVLQTNSGHEKRVARSLQQYIERDNFGDLFSEILVPTEEVVEMRSGQRRTTERNFYPGYVFINMKMTASSWHLVNSIPHITNLLGGKNPTPLSKKEAQNILDQVKAGENNPRPRFYFAPGELVRITDGPFEEFSGTVEDVNYERNRLRVSVTLFGRSTPVELEFSQVTKS